MLGVEVVLVAIAAILGYLASFDVIPFSWGAALVWWTTQLPGLIIGRWALGESPPFWQFILLSGTVQTVFWGALLHAVKLGWDQMSARQLVTRFWLCFILLLVVLFWCLTLMLRSL